MNKQSQAFLKSILNAPSPSGYELPASRLWREYTGGYADELIPDVHGNSIAILNPDAPFKFMLAGHIDEIGLVTTHIDDKGYLYTAQIGGMDTGILTGQRVRIMTRKKGEVFGVIGRKAIHQMKPEERAKSVDMDKIWVDIGAKNRKDAERRVSVGDPMVMDVECRTLHGDKLVSRATDNKAGAYVVAEVIRVLSRRKLNVCVMGVATVQEEVGLRGATTSTYNINPDAGIAIDVAFSSDHPDTDAKKTGEVELGSGPVLHRGPNINPIMAEGLFASARAKKIPYQMVATGRGTGTDANAMQLARGGVATGVVGVPNRYMHSPVEVISTKDLDNAVKLISEYIASHPAQKDYRPR